MKFGYSRVSPLFDAEEELLFESKIGGEGFPARSVEHLEISIEGHHIALAAEDHGPGDAIARGGIGLFLMNELAGEDASRLVDHVEGDQVLEAKRVDDRVPDFFIGSGKGPGVGGKPFRG